MEKFEYRSPGDAKVQQTELYKRAPAAIKRELDRDPNFLRGMVYHLAGKQDGGSLLVYPFLDSGSRSDWHLDDFYNRANEDSKRFLDECCAEFIQARKDQLAAYSAAYEKNEDWNGDLNSPPLAVRNSGFHREPRFVYDRMCSLQGENQDIRPFDEDSLKRDSRYGQVFDRYYQGSQAFRKYANKMYREYPSIRDQEFRQQLRNDQMRRDREQEALAGVKGEILERLRQLRQEGHSVEAVGGMLEAILRTLR